MKHNTNQQYYQDSTRQQFRVVVMNAGFSVRLPEFESWLCQLRAREPITHLFSASVSSLVKLG